MNKNENGEIAKAELSEEQKQEIQFQKLQRKLANLHIFVDSLEVTIKKCKPAIDGNKRVLMLPQTKLPLAYDPETKELCVSAALKPQLFSRKKCKFFREQWQAGDEGKPLIVTKLHYYKARLKAAKGLLELYKKSINTQAAKNGNVEQRKEYNALMKQYKEHSNKYKELSEKERKSKAGKSLLDEIRELHKEMYKLYNKMQES